jgi:hypothetical protein
MLPKSDVLCHQRQIMDQRYRGDHQVYGINGNALLQQTAADLSKLLGTRTVEIEQDNFLEQVSDESQQARWIWMSVCAGIQFGQDDGRYGELTGMLQEPMRQATRPAHVSGTDVRVEQKGHSASTLGRRSCFRA